MRQQHDTHTPQWGVVQRLRHTHTPTYTRKHTHTRTYTHKLYIQTERQTDRQTDRQTELNIILDFKILATCFRNIFFMEVDLSDAFLAH